MRWKKWKNKADEAEKLRNELLKLIEQEKRRLIEYPGDSGPFDLTMRRNISPIKSIKKKVGFLLDSFQAEEEDNIEASLMKRSKSARRIKDLRSKQKSKRELVRDLENFHKSWKHQVRNAHMKRNMGPDLFNFDEAKSANIFLQSKNTFSNRGYISPTKRLNMPTTTKRQRMLKRAKSAIPLKMQKRDLEIQTDRNPRDKSPKENHRLTLTPRPAKKKDFFIDLKEIKNDLLTHANQDSPSYSVKLSYSHYAPSTRSPTGSTLKGLSPRSKLIQKKKEILEKDKMNSKVLRRKQRLKKKKKILNVVYGDKIIAGGSYNVSPRDGRRMGLGSALKMVDITGNNN